MKYFKKETFWSLIEIETDKNIENNDLVQINTLLEDFENKYSRFKKNNFLYNLNKTWKATIDEEFKTLFDFCSMLNEITDGCFDITVASVLENLGYWIEKEVIDKKIWFKNIEIALNEIILNNTTIEFWAIWKGYIIDKIYDILIKKHEDFIINFGWDIRVWKSEKVIWLEDPYDNNKLIWEIKLKNIAFWSSSGQKRAFWDSHHLINSKNKTSQDDKLSIYLTHKYASFADGFSTALFVTPLEQSLIILNNTPWLEWMIISESGEIYKSSGFDVDLY